MANTLRGEAELVAEGLGTFTLVMDANALANIQGDWRLDGKDQAFLDRLFMLPVALHHDVRIVLRRALERRHGATVRDLHDAGSVLDAAGLGACRAALVAALSTSFPEAVADGGRPGDSPPKAGSPGAGPA